MAGHYDQERGQLYAVSGTSDVCQLGRRHGCTGHHGRSHIDDAAAVRPVLCLPEVPSHSVHAFYKWYAYVRPENLAPGWTRDRILEQVGAAGVPCYQGSCSEVYLEKAFEGTGWRPRQRLPVARKLGETSLMLLVHPTLTASDTDNACRVLTQVLEAASLPALKLA